MKIQTEKKLDFQLFKLDFKFCFQYFGSTLGRFNRIS
jgi:hypothetical protein